MKAGPKGSIVKPLTKRERLAMTHAHPTGGVVQLLDAGRLTDGMSFQFNPPRPLTLSERKAMAERVAVTVVEFLKALPEEPQG